MRYLPRWPLTAVRARTAGVIQHARLLVALTLVLSCAGLVPYITLAATSAVCPSGCTYASIQAAIDAAASGDTITIGAGTYAELLTIGKNLTLQGAGAAHVTINGGGNGSVVTTQSDSTVTIDGVTITGGNSTASFYRGGGGIINDGTLTVTNSTLSGNSASGYGGAISNFGTLTVTNSTLSGNSAAHGGAGIYTRGTLTVTNSTLSGNSATFGGGIYIYSVALVTVTNSTLSSNSAASFYGGGGGIYNDGTLTVTNSTLSGNSADGGGGIINFSTLAVTNSTFSGNSADSGNGGAIKSNFGTTTLSNTIVANSPVGGNCNGSPGDSGGNLSSDASCGFTATSSQNSVDPRLDPNGLQNNGGPTQTIALLSGSPAINGAVSCPPPATDQRGITRPQGPACDSGAFEVVQNTPTNTPTNTLTPTATNTPVPPTNTPTNTPVPPTNTPTNTPPNTPVPRPADTTPPEISLTTPTAGAQYTLNQVVTAAYSCTDTGSGVKTCAGTVANGSRIDTTTVGLKSFSVTATDNAGNTATKTVSYTVTYTFSGFSSPVDAAPVVNSAKAGQTIPLKWRITDAHGVPVTNLTTVQVGVSSLECSDGTGSNSIAEYATGDSGLQNLGDGYYQFNWKTPKSYAGSCKTITLGLGEGSTALFQFK